MTIDELLAAYCRDITEALAEAGLPADEHEIFGQDVEDGPAATWRWRSTSASVAPSWPEGVTIIWDPSTGWIDHDRVPLPLPLVAHHVVVMMAIRSRVTGREETVRAEDVAGWVLADDLARLLPNA
jgi:hypothetical protein